MRKVLSFVLVLSLVLGSFGFAFAAPADVQGTKNEMAVEVLMALDIINGYEDGTYRPDNIVTRAEMAKILIAASGYGDIVNEAKSNFSDMAGHWADKYVAYAASLGLVNGYPDGTFKPNQTVSYAEAATMMVRALGYTDASLSGTWPANYVTRAMVLGLYDKVSTSVGGATRGDIAQMTFALLDEDFGKVDKDNIWVKDANGDTMLKRLGAVKVDDYLVKPSDNTSSESYIDLTGYVGQIVDLYKERTGDEKIICVTKVESDVIKGELDTKASIVKGLDGKEYKLTTLAIGTVYTNGVSLSGITAGAFNTTFVTVAGTLSGLTMTPATLSGTKPQTVKRVTSSDVYAIDDVVDGNGDDLFSNTVPRKDDKSIDYGKMKVVGSATKLEDIEKDNVVLVFTEDHTKTPSKIVKIVVSDKKVEGKITKLTTAPTRAYIDGTAYKLAPGTSIPTTDLGATITAYVYTNELGTFIQSYKVTDAATAGNYAMVLDTTNGFDDLGTAAKIKLLTKSGEIINFPVSKTAKVVTGSGASEVDLLATSAAVVGGIERSITSAASSLIVPQAIVRYSTNANGDINKVIVAATGTSSVKYNSVTNYIGTTEVASNVVVFKYNASDVDKSKVITTADLENDPAKAAFNAVIATNPDGKAGAIAVSTTKSTDNVYGVVASFGSVKDANDDTVLEVNMLVNGESITYLTTTDVTSLTKNALYKLTLSGGKIADGTVISKSAVNIKTDATNRTITAINTDSKVVSVTTDGGVTSTSFQYNDETTVYVAKFKADDSFDKWEAASSPEAVMTPNAYVAEYDLYDSDEIGVYKGYNIFDTIFVIRKSDWGKTI